METNLPSNVNTPPAIRSFQPAPTQPQHVGISPTPKSGFSTSEFWTVFAALVLVVLWSCLGDMPSSIAGVLAMVISLGYAYLRGCVKNDHNAQFDSILNTLLTASASLPAPALVAGQFGQALNSIAPLAPQPQQTAPPAGGSPAGGCAGVRVLACLAILSLAGCAATKAYLSNPNTISAMTSVVEGAIAYIQGNDVGAATDGVSAAAYFVRSLQSTPNAANPAAVVAAVKTGGASPIATTVANAITALTQAGAKPDAANEQIAQQLDQAVLQTTSDAPDAVPLTIRDTIERRRWRAELQRGDLSRDEFASLVRGQIDIDENMVLKRSLGRAWAPAHVLRAPLPPDWDPVWFQFQQPSSALRFRNRLPDLRDDEREPAPVMFVVR